MKAEAEPSVETILEGLKFEAPDPKKGETTLSVWVSTELKERHRRLPPWVRKRVAGALREIAEVIIGKAEKQAS